MKSEIYIEELNNPSVMDYFFRDKSSKTYKELLKRAKSYNDAIQKIEDYALFNMVLLEDIEEMLYDNSVEEVAQKFNIEIDDEEE